MGRRFYESGPSRRAAAAARGVTLAASLLALTACGREPSPPPAPAVDARAVDAVVRAVEAYLASDKPSEAVFVSEKLAAERPELMRSHEVHGRALVALAMRPDLPSGDRAKVFARAADAYLRAAALAPGNAALQHAAGVVCDTAGRHTDAVRLYAAAHAADPGNAQFALYLGMALARDGKADEARTLLEAAERAMPESPDPKAALADLEMRAGHADAARTRIAQARALNPGSVELRVADARLRRLAGAPRESLELLLPLDAPVRRAPMCAEEIAAAYEALGQPRDAAGILEESASAEPNDWKRALRSARAWAAAGDPVRATIAGDAAALAGAPAEEVRAAVSGASAPRPAASPSP